MLQSYTAESLWPTESSIPGAFLSLHTEHSVQRWHFSSSLFLKNVIFAPIRCNIYKVHLFKMHHKGAILDTILKSDAWDLVLNAQTQAQMLLNASHFNFSVVSQSHWNQGNLSQGGNAESKGLFCGILIHKSGSLRQDGKLHSVLLTKEEACLQWSCTIQSTPCHQFSPHTMSVPLLCLHQLFYLALAS